MSLREGQLALICAIDGIPTRTGLRPWRVPVTRMVDDGVGVDHAFIVLLNLVLILVCSHCYSAKCRLQDPVIPLAGYRQTLTQTQHLVQICRRIG